MSYKLSLFFHKKATFYLLSKVEEEIILDNNFRSKIIFVKSKKFCLGLIYFKKNELTS